MNRRRVAALGLIAMLLVPGVAMAGVAGSPELDAFLSDNTVEPGTETTLAVQITNNGDSRQVAYRPGEAGETATPELRSQVTTARNLRAELESGDAPVEVLTDTVPLGVLQNNGVSQAQFRIAVEEGAESGTYRLPLQLKYTHPARVDGTGEVLETEEADEEEHVTIRITDSARFEIVNVSTGAQVGGSGPVELTMENTGSEAASDATITLQSTNSDVVFGQSNSASQYVGNWSAGERQTVRFQATVGADAITEPYAMQATVQFDNENGVAAQSPALSTGIVPRPEQSFSLSAGESTLRVGREGNLTGTITNEGPTTAHDAVVTFAPSSRNIDAQETQFALGTLEPNESADFSVPIEISDSGEAGQQQFTFRVQYQNDDDQQRQSEPLNTRSQVQPRQPLFDVRMADGTLNASETRPVTLLVTNNGDRTLRNVDAEAFANSPLSLATSEAYTSRLEPGETAELVLELGVGANAIPNKTYSYSVDFQYDTPSGETRLSDTYSVPVNVVDAADEGGFPVWLVGVVVVLVVVIAGVVIRYMD